MQHRALNLRYRVYAIAAIIVLSGFGLMSAVGIGVALHGRSETLDSLEHWQARLEEEESAPESTRRISGFDSPASRIRRLEEELDTVPERLFALGSMFVLTSVLVALGVRALRRGRRAP